MMFLEPEDIRVLTGKAQKAKQVEQLRRMGVPFYLNASGEPIVARAVIEGNRQDREKAARPKRTYPWEENAAST